MLCCQTLSSKFCFAFLILTNLRVISGSLGLCLAIFESGWVQKIVLESLHISEKTHFLGFTLSCILVLTNFKVILGFLGLCCANWGWERDQKTVLGSTHKYTVSTFDF